MNPKPSENANRPQQRPGPSATQPQAQPSAPSPATPTEPPRRADSPAPGPARSPAAEQRGGQGPGQSGGQSVGQFGGQAMDQAPLLSNHSNAAVSGAFNALAHTILAQNARTLEDLVSEMLRPMLKEWLDDNLPSLVERVVTEEIERVSRGRR